MTESARLAAAGGLAASRPWHGPRILATGFVSYFVSTGLVFSILGIFIRPAAEAFSASMATMGALPSFYHVISAAIGPFLGVQYARGRIRRFMLIGAVLLPLGLVAASRADTLVVAAACYGSGAVIGAFMMGPLASNTLVTNWFGPSRGRALGIIATGSTVAGILLPTIAALLIEQVGWRDALALLAVASLLVTLPAFATWAVDRPEDLGQLPEPYSDAASSASPSSPASPAGSASAVEAPPASTGEILRTPHFWAIAAAFGLLFSSSLISITFTVPYAEQLGLSLRGGAYVLAARSLAAVAGQVTLGWLSDRIGRRTVLWGAIAVETACWFAVVRAPSILIFTLAGIGIGFVSGSFAPLRGALVARVFGRRDFAKVSGLLSPASLPFQILAVPLAGHLYDLSGDYSDAFQMFLFVFPVTALLIAFIPDRR